MSQDSPFAGTTDAALDRRVAAYLRRRGLDTDRVAVERLTGDASSRVYLRVSERGAGSWLLVAHREPFAQDALPQIEVGRLLQRLDIPIPRILDQAGDLGLLAVDDLGDRTLQRWLDTDGNDPTALYEEAVGLIARLQRGGATLAEPGALPFTMAFDVEKLSWELDYFRSEFLGRYRGVEPDMIRRSALDEEFADIARRLAAEPRVLCHRDYHSRNLMVVRDGLMVIDFQDARLGPGTYDLVSLLRDCYVDLPPALVEDLTARFLRLVPTQNTDDFPRRFDLMSVQRHLKALGTFGHQIAVAERPGYADAVPRTLGHLRRTLHADPVFGRLLELLADMLPELG